jgi:malate dehydrogenase (oxaloacetate-decarboxylating)(NADP+)
VLGLGNVGALAGKPVMEGKAVLFKRFANIDSIDLEIDSEEPKELINIIKKVSPSFGGINLEDIKAPECFEIEEALVEQLDIPVFHDDQHGTAIVVAASLLNALELQNKSIDQIKLTCVGAGAAGIATINLLIALGLKQENICLVDTVGVIYQGRSDLNKYKQALAIKTNKRSLADAMVGADVFIGVSKANVLTKEMLKTMAKNPIVFAMANPDPEIHPKIALETREDLIMATGRSDFPNQVNNTLCFPYIFRAALDVRASKINIEMKIAAVHAIRNLAKEPVIPEVLKAYNLDHLEFGPNYIVPKPLDPRLLEIVPPAIAKAAIATGVAK